MKGFSKKEFNGVLMHFDENNRFIGSTKPSIGRGVVHFNADNQQTGYSKATGSGYMHYDLSNRLTGYSKKSFNGGFVHYDINNDIIGSSLVAFNGYIHKEC